MADRDRRLSILLLADADRKQAANLREHVHALRDYSRHRVFLYNPRGVTSHSRLELDAFDVVVIHWSLVVISDSFLSPDLREKIRAYRGLKIQFLQDEYRWVDEITTMLRRLEIDVLFTVAPPLAAQQLYSERLPGVEIVETFAGFVPEGLVSRQAPPIERRTIDVGYRGRALPPWLGRLGYEKVEIGRRFLRQANGTVLRCDIAWTEYDRIYGDAWYRFLMSCRTTLGTESGASIVDTDRSVERRVLAYLDEHRNASFEEIHAAVLDPYEGNIVINVISPRVLEAAALRTGLVLHPGEYSHAIVPWKNYLPLEKDFSNFDEVAAAIRDVPTLQQLADTNYEELVASGRFSLRSFVASFDDFVASRVEAAGKWSAGSYWSARFARPYSTRTAFGVEYLEPLRIAIKIGAVARALARDADLRRFAVTVLARRDVRARVRLGRLSTDLLRLAVVRAAHQRRPLTTERFAVVPSLDTGSRTLTLVSVPAWELRRSWDGAEEEVRVALASGDIDAVLWNHLAFGSVFTYRSALGRELQVLVGYVGVSGLYQFGALSELVARDPAAAWRILADLLQAPALRVGAAASLRRRTDVTVRWRRRRLFRQFERSPLGALVRHPGHVVLQAAISIYALAAIRRLRTIVDRKHGLTVTLGDALRLFLLRRAISGRIATVGSVRYAVGDDGVLVVRSRRALEAGQRRRIDVPGGTKAVVWDHSEIGSSVHARIGFLRLNTGLGDDGRYEFASLRRDVRIAPDAVTEFLTPMQPLAQRLARGGRLSLALRPLLMPRDTARRVGVLLLACCESRAARAALAEALSGRIPVGAAASDAVRLYALGEAAAGRVEGVAGVLVTHNGKTTRYTSIADGRPVTADETAFEATAWDHSAVGHTIALRAPIVGSVEMGFGPDGMHRFRARSAATALDANSTVPPDAPAEQTAV